MKQRKVHNIKLGLFITLGIVFFAFVVYFLGKERNLFGSTMKVYAVFSDVKGLQVGNNVRFSGINIGTISDIEILTDTTVKVELSIDSDLQQFIKETSQASIGTEGLMGNKLVLISPGKNISEAIKPGEVLPTTQSVELNDIFNEVENAAKNISDLSEGLYQITKKINRGDGMFGTLFNDTIIAEELRSVIRDANVAMNDFNRITEKINTGEGDLGRLVNDTTITAEIVKTTDNINDITVKLESVSAKLNTIAEMAASGDGTVHKLLADSTFADSISVTLNNLNKGIVEITETSEEIKKSWLINLFK